MSNKLTKNNGQTGKKKTQKNQQAQQMQTARNKGLIAAACCIVVIVLALVIFFVTNNKNKTENSTAGNAGTGAEVSETSDMSDVTGPIATITVKDYGDIVVQLDENAAPLTVANFVSLAKDGFYDGLTFHRIIDGFMIQGGDPLGNGTGGSDETIKGEFSSNGVDNPISHVRGVISMARSNAPDSASSQFFIVQADSTYLDGEYAGFGYVTSGMDIVDQICKDVPVQDNNGTVNAEDQPIIESIVISEE